jgi:hypothetical protein
MDMMIDKGMIEYDKLMQEKHAMGESRRFTESRKKRRQMEEV